MSIRAPPLDDDDEGSNDGEDAVPLKEGQLWEVYERRKENNQDLVILIADHQNRRGTGKSTLTLKLGDEMDATDEGLTIDKCALDPVEIRDAYTREKKKSALAMDEAEAGIGNRDSMTLVNKALMEIMSMGRVEEKYVILNAPNANRIDKAVRELTDFLILVEARGRARVYRLVNNPFENQVYFRAVETIHWDTIEEDTQLAEVYDELTAEKKEKLRGEDDTALVKADEVDKKVRMAVEERELELRDELIINLVQTIDGTYDDVADMLPEDIAVSGDRVGQIFREWRDNTDEEN